MSISVAMIGTRGHPRYVTEALPRLPQVKVIAACDGAADDPVALVVEQLKSLGQSPEVFSDYRKMLDTAKPQAVVICGPFHLHAKMAIDSIERGIHVFVEKLAALNFEDLAKLRAAIESHPEIHVANMMGSRFDPGFFTAWKMVRSGAIGDVRILNARKSYKLGKRAEYFHARETYGGTMGWVGSHAIDWVLWMLGHKLETISAFQSDAFNDGNGTMERAATVQLGFCKGRSATISLDLFRPETAPTHGDDWLRIVGTQGIIEARPQSLHLLDATHDGATPMPVETEQQVFIDFVNHLEGKSKAMINAQQTLVLTEVCLLARDSADQQKTIRIADDRSLKYRLRDD